MSYFNWFIQIVQRNLPEEKTRFVTILGLILRYNVGLFNAIKIKSLERRYRLWLRRLFFQMTC